MAISFPASPSLNDTFTAGGVTYTFDGTVWVSSGSNAFVLKSGDTVSGDLSIDGDLSATGFTFTNTGVGTFSSGNISFYSGGSADYTGGINIGGQTAPDYEIQLSSDGKGTFSTGVLFGTDTAAANTLDDYEEGTWTPALENAGSPTVTDAYGIYTKTGNFVHCTFFISFTGATLVSSSRISGLPFAYNASVETDLTLSRVGSVYDSALSLGNRVCHAVGHTSSGSTWIYLDNLGSGSAMSPRGHFVMRV